MTTHGTADRWPIVLVLRIVVGGCCALAGLRLFLPPAPIASAAALLAWFGFALGIGYGFASAWALPLALLPFFSIAYTRATGPEYLGSGDASWLASAFLIAVGAGTIGLGAGLHRWALRAITWHRTIPPAPTAILLLVPPVAALLLGTALDLAGPRAFLSLPRPMEVPRVDEGELRATVTGLPFVVYGAAEAGRPRAVLRQTVTPPTVGPTEIATVIYCDARCRRASEVQIQSAPRGYHSATDEQRFVKEIARTATGTPAKVLPPTPSETVTISGINWRVAASGPQPGAIAATADLPGASVRISAPDRATFERVAANLRSLTPAP